MNVEVSYFGGQMKVKEEAGLSFYFLTSSGMLLQRQDYYFRLLAAIFCLLHPQKDIPVTELYNKSLLSSSSSSWQAATAPEKTLKPLKFSQTYSGLELHK